MEFLRFRSIAGIATITILLMAGAQARAEGEGDDMPLPSDKNKPAAEAPLGEPAPQDELSDEAFPAPSLGDQSLPEPKQDKAAEKEANVVNKKADQEEIFLPTPALNDNSSAPLTGTPVPGRVTAEDLDYRAATYNRPVFMIHAGFAARNYPSNLIKDTPAGYRVGASIRLFNVAQTVYLHGFGGFDYFHIGQVGPFSNVSDSTFRLGGMLEIGLGRRLSLYGSLLRRSNTMAADQRESQVYFQGVKERSSWLLGAGLQYDFYVVPHGSIGLLAHVERDIGSVVFTMAIEPKPAQKIQLNFDELE